MRILVSYRGAPRIRGWETGAMVARAFERLGHDVVHYAKIYEDSEWALPRTPDKAPGTNLIASPSQKYLDRQYDLHVFMECNDPEPQYLNLREVRAEKHVGWFFDTSYYPHMIKNLCNAMQFDWIFSANPLFGQNFFGPCTSVLAYAADPDLHFRPLDTPKSKSIALVGSDRSERRRLINLLEKVVHDAHLISDVFRGDYVDALASAGVVVNENPPQGRGLLNMRTFEAPAAGALLLSQEGDFVENYFTKGVSVLTYNSPAELVSVCRSLVAQPEIVENVRAEGQNRVREDHLYDHRVQEMLDILGF